MDGNRAVAPRIVKPVAAIRNKDQVDVEFTSSLIKAARLVAKFGGEDKKSRHLLLFGKILGHRGHT